jgi:hypothetical protein
LAIDSEVHGVEVLLCLQPVMNAAISYRIERPERVEVKGVLVVKRVYGDWGPPAAALGEEHGMGFATLTHLMAAVATKALKVYRY